MRHDSYKSRPYLPEIFGIVDRLGKNDAAKYTIHYPKSELQCLVERENKVVEWSNKNKAIINRLTSKRYPPNYFAEMEKAALSKRGQRNPEDLNSKLESHSSRPSGMINFNNASIIFTYQIYKTD
jgi:hypothetical protein